MNISTEWLLLAYSVAIALLSLAGGLLPSWIRMTHTRTQLVMSFVSGLMLGVAFYHLLPHSLALQPEGRGADSSVWWLMIGLIVMLLLLRMFHFHQHDFSDVGHRQQVHAAVHDHDHDHDHGHPHAHNHAPAAAHRFSWVGLALGLGLHTLIDGVALGAVLQGEAGHAAGPAGVGVFLAILLHKPLDAMSITTIMEAGGWSARSRTCANLGFALMCPLGAMLFYFGVDLLGDARHYAVAVALAFAAGTFICIALSDLLPEVHFHSHDRGKLTLVFLAGIVLAYAIGAVEPGNAHLPLH
ncbi:ZIP family metal transporter [Kineobactrum salinum]|uniref:ZIP family metal transporter n=1 Tax=Kineobactrum salinum TaxID=2708301 RepID=A0A6C0U4A0_9GAMM|nr:ZIP family metal transporter [Kineobactrum salinum]QIB66249.1 ZIP family metal transporter [Kineobactrum salinum]